METFNINRLWMVLKWTFISSWKSFLRMTCLFFLFLLAIFELNTLDNSSNIGNLTGSAIFFFVIVIIVGASLNFSNMKEKEGRITFLIQPASNLEKYIARYLYITIGFAVSFFVALLAADILRALFLIIAGRGVDGSVFMDFSKRMFDFSIASNSVMVNGQTVGTSYYLWSVVLALFLIWVHSVYLLGGAFFRRNAWLFTTLTMLVITMVFGWILSTLDFNINFNIDFSADSNKFAYLFLILFSVMIIFNYIASYKLFVRMQVINNKWINI